MNAGTHARWMIVGAFLFALGMWTQDELTKRRAEEVAKYAPRPVSNPVVYRLNCNVREVVEACKTQRRMEKVVAQ